MIPLYLDHNAGAPLKAEARVAMLDALDRIGNASSVHRFGRAARRLVEDARDTVAALVAADPAGVIFTASGTEANNLALRGFPGRSVITSAIEHPSVLAATPDACRMPVDHSGVVDLAALRDALSAADRPALVSLMLANNETGVIQPVAEAATLAHSFGALIHCDAVQGPGRIALDIAALGVDLLTLSAHKLGGPQGAAALVLADDIDPAALIRGGGQERGRRAGTENVAAIAGFGAAAATSSQDLSTAARQTALRDAIAREICAAAPAARIIAEDAPRLPNTLCVVMPGVPAETQLIAFDLAGLAVSAGSACSSGKLAASHVLRAMGYDESEARSAIRISLGPQTGDDAVERVVAAWLSLWLKRAGGTDKRDAGNSAAEFSYTANQ